MNENICSALHRAIGYRRRYSLSELDHSIPADGVYFLFEFGEEGHDGQRIVYVGGHNGVGNLLLRMHEHTVLNKDRSIFRKHIGRALLERDADPYLAVWNLDFTSREARERRGHLIDTAKQANVEASVSAYIESSFTVGVSPHTDLEAARRLKERCIGTVSSCQSCAPSSSWLGTFAPKPISKSGLWQIKNLYEDGLAVGDLPMI